MSTPQPEPTPLAIEIIPAPHAEGDPVGQVRVGAIRVNGIDVSVPSHQILAVATTVKPGEAILVNLTCYATIGTAEQPSE